MLHLLKYRFLYLLRAKENIFWTLLFPIALSTFMYMAFSNIYQDELFEPISVAVVEEQENEAFITVAEGLAEEGENQMLIIKDAEDEAEAKSLLEEDEIKGVFLVKNEVSLLVKEEGMEQTILSVILSQYNQSEYVVKDVLKTHPEQIEVVVENIMAEADYCMEQKTSSGNQDAVTNYFYAIFAMACLFASFNGLDFSTKLMANTSPLGMRKTVSSCSKWKLIVTGFFSSLVIQYASSLLGFAYMNCVLGVDFGEKYAAICLLLLMGNCIGLGMGMIIGCIGKIGEEMKTGIAVGISMALSVMADLCASGVKDAIEHTVPIINRLNPAALIVDSFYALNIYDTYTRFFENMTILAVMTAVLFVISILLVRRNRHASL